MLKKRAPIKIKLLKSAGLLVIIMLNLAVKAQVPYITSLDKQRGRPQETVVIRGLNFGNNASNIKVWFGAVSVAPTVLSDQYMEVKVPFGAYYESVRVQNNSTGLSAASPINFLPSFGGTNPFNETRVSSQLDFPAGLPVKEGLYDIALADFDGDGKSDVATANKESTLISIFRNTSTPGSINFVKTTLNPAANTIHAAAGDLNGDGKQDLVATESDGARVFIYRSTSTLGSISFVQQTISILGSKLKQIRIEDMDLDGKPDLILTDQATGTARFHVLRNQSTLASISLSAPQTITLASTAGTDGIYIHDMNGDHLPDIAMGEFLTSNARIFTLRNTSVAGTISFFQYPTINVNSTVSNFAIGDLDGDQKPDVALTLLLSASVMILKNETTGTELDFAEPVLFDAGIRPWGIDIGDADGDGKMDIAVASVTTKTIRVLNNNSTSGNLAFTTKTINTGFINRIIKFGDMDNDGRPDLVFTSIDDQNLNVAASKVSVFRNINCVVPVVTPPGPLTVCSVFTQRLQSSESPGALYEWFNGGVSQGAPSAQSFRDVSASGSYTVRLTDAGCSQTSNAVVINVVATGPLGAATISPVPPVCKNGTLTLTVSNVGATQYNWTGPGGFAAAGLSVNRTNFQPVHAGRYDLDVIVGTCVAERLSVVVDIVDVPGLAIQFEGADIICAGNNKTLSVLPNVTGFSYQWAKTTAGNISGATGATFNATESGNYLVKLKSTLNPSCPEIVSADKKLRIVNPPVVDFTFPATICSNAPVTFTDASTTDPDPADPTVEYKWNFGDGSSSTDKDPQHTFASAQSFNVELSVSYRNSACPTSAQKSVTVTAAPSVQITNPDGMSSVCVGGTLELQVLGNFNSYLWSTGETTSTIEVDAPGTYTVDVDAGCIIRATKTLGSLPKPNASASVTPKSINIGDVVALKATGLSDYTWSPADGVEFPNQANTNAIPPGNIVYTVSGRNSDGCYDEASVTITVIGGGSIGLLKPENYFSPNGDTFNPVWEVENAPVLPQCGVTIFDELGIKVFEAKPYNNDWDGTSSKGTKLPGGVYFYIIRCDDTDTILKGSINLIR